MLDGGEGERAWSEAGRPLLPSLVIDGAAVPILHRTQIASLLGLPSREEGAAGSLAWDCAALLQAWIAQLGGLPPELLVAPTRSRGRSIRNLTVNTFHPFELLPTACASGTFAWDPDLDDEREAPLVDTRAVIAYAAERHDGWVAFLGDDGDTLNPGRPVETPRGALALGALLSAQRWHVAYHYRQLIDFLRESGVAVADPFPLDRLNGLGLPAALY